METCESRSARHLSLVITPDRQELRFSAAEYLQLVYFGRRSATVEVVGVGTVDVVDGAPTRARDAAGEGRSALMRILVAGGLDGSVPARCWELQEMPLDTPKLDIDLARALLEAARLLDEASSEGPGTALATDRGGETPKEVDTLEEMMQAAERGMEALLDGDYSAAYMALAEANRLGHEGSLIVANLERLRELGYGSAAGSSS